MSHIKIFFERIRNPPLPLVAQTLRVHITQHIRYGLTPLPSGHCYLRSHVVYAGSVIHHPLKCWRRKR